MKVIETKIKDIKIIEPEIFEDSRGYFYESYNQNNFKSKIANINFVQDNQSKSKYGVLRGLHYQKKPYEQSKLIRVIHGKIQDVAVDIRKDSKTFLKYVSVILSEKNNRQLFIPKGFAHGFLVLSESAIVSYKVDSFYNKENEKIISFDDVNININWELNRNQITLSDKDKISTV